MTTERQPIRDTLREPTGPCVATQNRRFHNGYAIEHFLYSSVHVAFIQRSSQGCGRGPCVQDYASSIPFIKIADRVEVTVKLKANRVSGPPVALKK